MRYDFDRQISRRGTSAVKWEFIQKGQDLLHWEHTDEFFGPNRILPMWVADMDFRSPEPVVTALVARAEHGIYGYTEKSDGYYQSVVGWMERRHGWRVAPEWICTTPGVVPALNMLVRTFLSPGEKVLIQQPVYYPFFSAIENNGGQIVSNSLILDNGRYGMDFDDLEVKAQDPKVKMAILCSPHNPVGRVWRREELSRFGEICLRNNILVVSDEIHGDLIYKRYAFTPFASISEDIAQNAVICTAPSKTFNLAGLQTSNIIIPNADLRAKFEKTLHSNGLFGIGVLGIVATEAAYNHGEEWLEQLLDYVEGNLRYLEQYVRDNIAQISVIPPEGTYLVWLDCRRLGLGKWDLQRFMLNEARVYLDEGFVFGPEGEGFERINIACPRSILAEAIERIHNAIQRLSSRRPAGEPPAV
ncbi:MAG: pyridoxal phosphate-dependent aminotransferase [Anaerolineales bacterium]|nr:MAG: pyridoxal phosphate-dependent aminotransferase [Anaerolineales bacterium]